MKNIIEQQELLKDLSDRDIATEMQRPSGNLPLYLVAGEAKRRADLRQRFKAEQSGPPPTSTVQEDLLSNIMASQMPATGIAQGMPQQQMAMAPPPQQMAMAPQPQQMPAIAPTGEAPVDQIPQAQGIMAGQQGGMVQGFAGGGLVREDRKYQNPRGAVQGINLVGYKPIGAQAAYEEFYGFKPRRASLPVPEVGAEKKINPIREERLRRAEQEASGLENEAYSFVYRDPYPTNIPASLKSDVMLGPDGNLIVGRNPLDFSTEGPALTSGPIGVSPDIQMMNREPITTSATDYSSLKPLTADEIARGEVFRGNKELDKRRENLYNIQKDLKMDPSVYNPPIQKSARFNPPVEDAGSGATLTPPGELNTGGDLPSRTPLKTDFDGSARERKLLKELRGQAPKPFEAMKARLAERRAALAEDRDMNVANLLMDYGSRIAAGESQYALTNIGKAGAPALKAAQDRKAAQEGREDAILASDMGIISGERQVDQDLQNQASRLVGYERNKQINQNKEITAENDNEWKKYSANVAKAGVKNARDEFVTNMTNNFAQYKDARFLKIQDRKYSRNLDRYNAENKRLDVLYNNQKAISDTEYRRRKDELDQKIRQTQLTRQSINDAQDRLDRKETRFQKVDDVKSERAYKTSERVATNEAAMNRLEVQIKGKKDIADTAAKLKNLNEKNKRVRTAWKDAIKIAIGTEGGALPPKTDKQAWDNLAAMYRAQLLDSGYPMTVIDALVSDKILRSRGSSGGGGLTGTLTGNKYKPAGT